MYNTGIFFQILLVGMGFEHWEVRFRKKNGLGNGTGTAPATPGTVTVTAILIFKCTEGAGVGDYSSK